mgnify:CR=1 FL=1
MKILLFSHEFPPMVGGAGSYTFDLAMGLKKKGHSVTVLAGKSNDPKSDLEVMVTCKANNIEISRIDWINTSRFWFLSGDKPILKYLKEHGQFDLMIFCNYTSNIIGSKIYEKLRIPYRIVIHGTDIDYFFGKARLKDFLMFRKTEMVDYFRNAETVISVSNYLQNILLAYLPDLINTKVVYNGIDLDSFSKTKIKVDKFKLLSDLGFTGNEKIIFCAGRLVKGKGQDTLIRVFSSISERIQDAVLLLAGDGKDLTRLKELSCDSVASNRVVFLGSLSRSETANYYSNSDLFVSLSRLNETFGIVFIEAMALGSPVIGSNIGGIPEVINDGNNGITVDNLNLIEIENAIFNILTNTELSNRFIDNGYKSVERKFNNLRMAEESIN